MNERMRFLLNLVVFQAAWFACVLGSKSSYPLLFPVLGFCAVLGAGHFQQTLRIRLSIPPFLRCPGDGGRLPACPFGTARVLCQPHHRGGSSLDDYFVGKFWPDAPAALFVVFGKQYPMPAGIFPGWGACLLLGLATGCPRLYLRLVQCPCDNVRVGSCRTGSPPGAFKISQNYG